MPCRGQPRAKMAREQRAFLRRKWLAAGEKEMRAAGAALRRNTTGGYHTYSTYARGVEALMGTYQFLDLAPWGRNEDGLEFPQAWWRRHDEYDKS